ncbi:aldehyde dehydrogenase family protein [Cohnella hongkongensis]|uniref:Aldehyde dehydrogenase family protein n=1 Tax=Cohnella hongkongensis TaxID=178337 RepID=A0ABV9F6B4_9BACL
MIYPMYIGGRRVDGASDRLRAVVNPATGETIGSIPMGTPEHVDQAVRAANEAAPLLARMTVFERADLCARIAAAIENNRERLAKLLSMEHGKPYYTEAFGEIGACISSFRDAAEQIRWMRSEIVPTRDPNKRAFVYRRPRGVYGVISPWNFPIGNPSVYYLAPGLAAGNAIVWVPAPSTAAIASEYVRIIVEEADLPAGALNLVIGAGAVVGDALVGHPGTHAIGFTGSMGTGNAIARRAGAKPCLLELGGNGPTIVLPDADVEAAALAIHGGCFSNAGQICTSTERILAHESVADALAEALAASAGRIKLGDPMDEATTMGPVHNEALARKVIEQIEDAKAKGARVLAGGGILSDRPTSQYVQASVIDRVSLDAFINSEETFGPVAPIIRFKDGELEQAIESSPYRLSAAIFSRDIEKALLMAEQMRFGIVNINESSHYWETVIPAGGASGSPSGYGRSGGKYSIEEMSELRTIVLNLPGGNSREIR